MEVLDIEKIIQMDAPYALTNRGRVFKLAQDFSPEGYATKGYHWEEVTLPGELQTPEPDID